jgi:hypothetical protein
VVTGLTTSAAVGLQWLRSQQAQDSHLPSRWHLSEGARGKTFSMFCKKAGTREIESLL